MRYINVEKLTEYLESERSKYELGSYDHGRNAIIEKTIDWIKENSYEWN